MKNIINRLNRFFVLGTLFLIVTGCKKYPNMTLSEIEKLESVESPLLKKTLSKPYSGERFRAGAIGGVWNTTKLQDPKTFNQLIAERDAASADVIGVTTDFLADYDMTKKCWVPHAANPIVFADVLHDTMKVRYILRDDLYWSYYGSDEKIPVTSDDYIFWYNEIAGDEAFASSGYAQQQVTMKDGSVRHIDCVKIDDKTFEFIFPRIVREPILATNMSCAPSFIFRPAKEKGGVEGVKALFPANCDVTKIPSCGKWFISEYTPAQRIVLVRNPNYWERDENGASIPYPEKEIMQIIGDANTDYLLFKEGKTETFSPNPENLSDVVEGGDNERRDEGGYSIFNCEGSLSAQFISFNQNPKNKSEKFYEWFCKKEFRQAMSCLINRQRLIDQSYRGLAEPKYDLFPPPNAYYNKKVELEYKYSPDKAIELLKTCAIERDKKGVMRDSSGNKIEFNLMVASSSPVGFDMALIIADECKKVGITLNIRQTDFQKLIEMLTATYDWEAVILALSGGQIFPSQGSNVWPSYGNLHLWNPLQKTPATDWEARVDYLYNEGSYCADDFEAMGIWSEYQKILLEECPLIYLVRPRGFFAIRNRWDLGNFYFDNANGAKTDWVYLK